MPTGVFQSTVFLNTRAVVDPAELSKDVLPLRMQLLIEARASLPQTSVPLATNVQLAKMTGCAQKGLWPHVRPSSGVLPVNSEFVTFVPYTQEISDRPVLLLIRQRSIVIED